MAKGKSPGSDGLPMELYIAFWDLLGEDLVNVFNASLEAGLLPFSQREALTALILKKGLDHKNWQPISLLNVDYKLCARVLAGRLLKVIALVVAPDQTCGVPGRYIGENVTFLHDVVELANKYNLPVALLSLDQEKAFDRVDWPFLFATLAKMGFGDNFIRWVRLLYTDVRSSILVNGYTSRPFKPSHGVRQVCPLSPFCTFSPWKCWLLTFAAILTLLVCAYLLFLLLSLYCPCMLMTRLLFRALIVPLERSSPFMLDSNKHYLGNGNLEEENWQPRINAVEKCLNSWRGRSLSYSGKALIVNALALSRVWYMASLVPKPDWVASELNTLVFSFFWSGKHDLVARDVVYHSTFQGGVGVVSVCYKVHALLAQWVRRYVTAPNAWAHMMTFCFFFIVLGLTPKLCSLPYLFSSW